MQTVTRIQTLQRRLQNARDQDRRIGLVPTMGFLHEGHLSLVRLARRHSDCVVVSIFVNPAQFGHNEDLTRYPRDLKRDCSLLRKEHVDLIFSPGVQEIYPDGLRTFVEVAGLSKLLCGVSRPDHFRGVATIVLKLFNIVEPDIAVFGQKDYQQLLIIRRMVRDLNLKLRIIAGKTVREPDGLAMSSRNMYLNARQRKQAAVIYRSLKWIKKNHRDFRTAARALAPARNMIIRAGGRVDYLEAVNPDTLMPARKIKRRTCVLAAVYFGKTRLIDNITI